MKKICYIITVPITAKAFLLKAMEYLHQETDWSISLICDEDREFASELPDYVTYYPIPMKRGISLGGIKAMREMYRLFRRERFDLIQYSTPNASLYAAMAGKKAGIPVRLYCQWGIAYVGFHGFKRSIFRLVEKYVCASSTWIEPDSKSNLEFSSKEGLYSREKASVIWNGSACGINTEKFDIKKREEYRTEIRKQYGIPEDEFTFCFVGRVTRDKGVNELLEAFRRILSQGKKIGIFMVGPSEIDETIDAMLYDWSVHQSVIRYTGYTNRVEKYMAASDCYILPSYREGFGLGVVEAEAMSLPVIVTDIPGPVDAMLAGETGVVIRKADVDSLEQAMLGFLDGTYDGRQMGSRAVGFAVEGFDQKEFMRRMLDDRKRLLQDKT